MATNDGEVLNLDIADLNRMKLEFYDIHNIIFQDAFETLRKTWIAKLQAMKVCKN